MSRILYNYKIYCNTEATFFTKWSETPPTTCPNNNTHEIDSSKTHGVDKISTDTLTVTEPTDGYFKCGCVEHNIPEGTAGDITVIERSWPFDILIWLVDIYVNDDMIGDYINIEVQPQAFANGIGYVTANTSAGATVLPVSSTVTEYMAHGFDVRLGSTNVGRCNAVNKVAHTLTLNDELADDVTVGTIVYPVIQMIHNFKFIQKGIVEFAKKGFKAKPAPANTIFKISYTNNTIAAKSLVIRHEYYYGF